MKRRTFFQYLLGGLGAAVALPVRATRARLNLIQESPVAGFQFYAGAEVWPSLQVGHALDLVRESENIHDPDAVAVYYQGAQLGYIPRAENDAVARLLDRDERLEARITRLKVEEDPWQRIRIGISRA